MSRKKTLFDPIPRGLRSDGKLGSLRVADPDGARHLMIVGMNGAGKTHGESPTSIVSAARGADLIIIDLKKLIQSYGDIAGVFQWMIPDEGLALALLSRLLSHTIPARTKKLASEGYKQWNPASELRFLRVQVEEAWEFVGANDLTDLGVTARSAGIQLAISLQRCTFDRIQPSLRSELSNVCHYGISSSTDARYGLSDELVDAGANPAQWRNNQPGMHYIMQKDVPLDEQLLPVRAWDDPGRNDPGSPGSFAAVAARVGADLHPMCPITAASLGDLWTHRVPPLELVAKVIRPSSPKASTARTLTVVTPEADPAHEDTMTTALTTPIEGDPPTVVFSADGTSIVFEGDGLPPDTIDLGEDPHPELVVNTREPIADLDPDLTGRDLRSLGNPVGQPGPNTIPKEDYERTMRERLTELMTSGELITPKRFRDVQEASGFTRPTIYTWLKKWEKEGLVKEVIQGRNLGYLPVNRAA